MKHILKALFILLITICASLPAFATRQDTSPDLQKRQLIKQLLDTTGSMNLGKQMLARMTEVQKSGQPPEVQARIDRLAERMDVTELTEQVVDIYSRHFTTEEIQAILDFYQSPTGKKYIAELPALMQEGMDAGQKWGAKKQEEFLKESQSSK